MRKLLPVHIILFFLIAACTSNKPLTLNTTEANQSIKNTPKIEADVTSVITGSPTESPTPALTSTSTPTDTPLPSPSPVPDLTDAIVFVSDRDGNEEIYRMNSNGSDVTRLTDNQQRDWGPQWAFDKSRILFFSDRSSSVHLYTMDPDGSNVKDLTMNAAWISQFSQCKWSKNSFQVACIGKQEHSFRNDLIILQADEENGQSVFSAKGEIFDFSWSPDGKQIALATSDVEGVMILDLTDRSHQDYQLGKGVTQMVAWSNNGKRIAYSFGPRVQGVFATLYTVKVDGSSPKQWISEGGPEWVLSWSPTDEFILLESSRQGPYDVFVFDFEQKELLQLTYTNDKSQTYGNFSPLYSQDGTRIVFVSLRDGQSEIYIMNSDGSKQINLTKNNASDTEPDW
jgi:Tol biopolymer transport system component